MKSLKRQQLHDAGTAEKAAAENSWKADEWRQGPATDLPDDVAACKGARRLNEAQGIPHRGTAGVAVPEQRCIAGLQQRVRQC